MCKTHAFAICSNAKGDFVNNCKDGPPETLQAYRKVHVGLFENGLIDEGITAIGKADQIGVVSERMIELTNEFFDGVEQRIKNVS